MPSSRAGDRRQAIGKRRKVAGDQREDAVAEEIDPVERAPALLAQVDLGEPVGGELGQQEVAVDPLVERQARLAGRRQLGRPAVVEGRAGPPGRPRSGRASGRRGRACRPMSPPSGQEAEVLGQERVDASGEVGHGASVGHVGWRASYDPARDRRLPHRARHPRGPPRPARAAHARPRPGPRRGRRSIRRSGAGRSPGRRSEADLRRVGRLDDRGPRRRHGAARSRRSTSRRPADRLAAAT